MGTLARGLRGHPVHTQMVLLWDPASAGCAPVTARLHGVVAGSVRALGWRSPTVPGMCLRSLEWTVTCHLKWLRDLGNHSQYKLSL